MSLDQRARDAAAELRDGIERLPRPHGDVDVDVVVRRARQRRRITRSLGATALVVVVGLAAFALAPDHESSAPIETTDGRDSDGPDGAVTAGRWTVVPKRAAGLPAASSLSAVASTGTSLLVAGSAPAPIVDDTTAEIWISADGLRWERADHPPTDGEVHAIAAAGDQALAIGIDGPLDRGGSTFVWRSEDGGRSWTEAAHGLDLFGPPAPAMGRPFVDGLLYRDGWWIAQGGAADGYAGAWVSRDGERWSQVLDSDEAGSAAIVAGADGELFAHWVRLGWFTTDPTSWGEPTEVALPDGFHLGAVADGAELAIGTSTETETDTVLLRSADGGRSWSIDETFSRRFPDAWPLAVRRNGDELIVAGASGQPNPAAWTSTDGRTWRALPADLAGPPGGTLSLIATARDTTVLFSTASELDRYYVLHDP